MPFIGMLKLLYYKMWFSNSSCRVWPWQHCQLGNC